MEPSVLASEIELDQAKQAAQQMFMENHQEENFPVHLYIIGDELGKLSSFSSEEYSCLSETLPEGLHVVSHCEVGEIRIFGVWHFVFQWKNVSTQG